MDFSTAEKLYERLRESIPKKQLFENVPMSRYTTLHLGGPARVLCEIASPDQLNAAFAAARELDVAVTLIGNGSNLLVKDGGIPGLVIHMGDQFAELSAPVPLPDGRFAITAQAGATLQKLCNVAMDHELTGLEFASGIPGTIGGAVYMNAGAYGGEMKDVVSHVTAVECSGKNASYEIGDLRMSYRHSRFCDDEELSAITSVTVVLTKGDGETIQATMREFSARRREKQPLTLPSCGSTFRRPEGQFAGTLIDEAGLKGFRIGGACVSPLHAGFLVNDENGTAADYLALINHVQRTVQEKTGILLIPEVRILGEDAPIHNV
ncbi:MAG: UDP-N-acetylmuramate dehydrogenase [Eubacteriales bacterium]|nr:UDP-N-acetylmuramate dehydrogenase [Eubacteriales bacterium]